MVVVWSWLGIEKWIFARRSGVHPISNIRLVIYNLKPKHFNNTINEHSLYYILFNIFLLSKNFKYIVLNSRKCIFELYLHIGLVSGFWHTYYIRFYTFSNLRSVLCVRKPRNGRPPSGWHCKKNNIIADSSRDS